MIIALPSFITGVFTIRDLIKEPKETVENLGAGYVISAITLGGAATSTGAVLLPDAYVFADATNTTALTDGGAWNQVIRTEGIDKVRLNILALGSVSTSTVDIKLMFSQDGTNYFDVMYSTSTPNIGGNGTTTPTIEGYVTSFVPGTATTSWSYDYDVTGARFTRFLLKSNNTGDLNIGAQAWITAILEESIVR